MEKVPAEPTNFSDRPTSVVFPWDVTSLSIQSDHSFHVWFADGVNGVVDLSALVEAKGSVFERIKDPSIFLQATVSDGVVSWPGDVDLAPDAMYEEILKNGHWKPIPLS